MQVASLLGWGRMIEREVQLYIATIVGAILLCLGGALLAVLESDWPMAALLSAVALVVAVGARSAQQLLRQQEVQRSKERAEFRSQAESLSMQEHLLSQIQIRSRKISEQLQNDVHELIRRMKIHHSNLSSDLRRSYERLPGEVLDLWRVGRLLPQHAQVPLPGDWAVTTSTLVPMLNEIGRNAERRTILECGSGTSTIWLAFAVKHRGHGHIYALEHDPEFAKATREFLRVNDLEAWATVVDAPLVELTVGAEPYRWYDLRDLHDLPPVDLLFVDGPPATAGRKARYPAFPLLSPRLSRDAWVVLDDTVREEEQEIASTWLGMKDQSVHLKLYRHLPKSTIMSAHSVEKSR